MIEEKINTKLLQQAIQVLRNLNEKHYGDSSKKRKLFEEEKESTLYLQFSLKKIPKCKSIKMIKINLPHSLVKDDSELCMITGDLDKKNKKAEIEPDRLHYKDLLKKHGISNISEVITLRQLRTEYKPYEAKQKLLAAYDVFLADRKIAECLPRVLGRHFFKKRKFPIQITLNTPNLKHQIEKALSTKVFYLTGHGNSCNSEVAYLDMSDEEITENIMAMVKDLCGELPGSWDNVMGIYLKTSLSKAIPIYMSYDDPNKVHLEEEANDNTFEIDELSTCPNSLVKVYRDGSVRTIRMKRMAESENSENTEVGDLEKRKKKKNINDNHDTSETTDLNAETTEIGEKKKKKKKNIDGNLDMSETTYLNAESAEIISNSEKRKKKKRIPDNFDMPEITKLKAETAYICGDSEMKKKRKNIIYDNSDTLTARKNAENAKIVDNSEKKKKKKNIHDNFDVIETTDLNEDSPKTRKKSKSKPKNEKSMSEQEIDRNICTTKKKEKQKQRKSLVNKR